MLGAALSIFFPLAKMTGHRRTILAWAVQEITWAARRTTVVKRKPRLLSRGFACPSQWISYRNS
jgi:hypothetical protein